jgi:hypothetical protein
MAFDSDVIEAARGLGIRLVAGTPLRWLTARGHLDPFVQRHAPSDILDALDDLHAGLGGDRRALAHKRGVAPRPDLMVEATGQLVELDEVEHFTTARLDSLARYPSRMRLGFSLDDYRALIDTWKARAHSVFTPRASSDFDFVGGRRAHRAYYDAVKDLLAPTFTSYSVLRLAVPDGDVERAMGALTAGLAY